MNARELLTEPMEYLAPARALEGLTTELADRQLPGAGHTIAALVAHLAFWQHWFSRRFDGVAEPMVQRAADGWPAVTPGTWPEIHRRFLDGLTQLVSTAEASAGTLDDPLTPAIEFPPLARYSRRDVLVHVATHNAHHLGQVILLRQLLGVWPPPAGSWTW
jgi:uncharacterized damage-inducible protein DinB